MVLLRLWRGEEPFERTFWTWGVLIALVVNVSTTAGTFYLVSVDRPFAAFFVGYVMSIPYNVFVLVAIWRSAPRSQETPQAVLVTRIIALTWLTLLSIT